MKTKKTFFRPNWFQINKAIDAGGEELSALRTELKLLTKRVDKKVTEAYQKREQKKRDDHEAEVRGVPVEGCLYFTGIYTNMYRFFGMPCVKVKDARKYITIGFNTPDGIKKWQVPYKDVQTAMVTEAQRDHANTNIQFRKFIQGIL